MNYSVGSKGVLSTKQHTLKDSMTFIGVGLHTGVKVVMTVAPGEDDTGIVFVRRDVSAERSVIPARWNTVIDTHLCTTVGNSLGVRVSTVEHLLAALRANGVDNAHIVLDGPEVPIVDGSSHAYVNLIKKIGLVEQKAERRAIVVKRPVYARESADRFACLTPSQEMEFDVEINFENPVIGRQRMAVALTPEIFNKHVAKARTFGFEDQVDVLKEIGFCRGGSLSNAVLVGQSGILNEGGLNYDNEFVRHKLLDSVGDLSLAGAYIVGRFVGRSSGHMLNNCLLRELMQDARSWEYMTLAKAYDSNLLRISEVC